MITHNKLEKLLEKLNMNNNKGLIFANDDMNIQQKKIFNKLDFSGDDDSIFFLNTATGVSNIPIVYFTAFDSFDEEKIAELHRVAWNLGEAPLLFVVLPDQLIIYNNYEKPQIKNNKYDLEKVLIEKINLLVEVESTRQIEQYSRNNLESGKYWKDNNKRFKIENRIDSVLIANLEFMRNSLLKTVNDVEVVHSLLGRTILIKYLEDRSDSAGNHAFPEGFFERFSPSANQFSDVLLNKESTYNLFEFFQQKFDGDMFPITSKEIEKIGQDELLMLKDFFDGTVSFENNQYNFWPLYSFNHIPIQLISTIYEMFFQLAIDETDNSKKKKNKSKMGTYYTPYHLVEMLFDEIFPWAGEYTDEFRIFDPSCGSGIFLVEAYRRIVSRWMDYNHKQSISPTELKFLLEKHIFGIDLNSESIRIASFSLSLVLCDYLEPLSIWESLTFPSLVGSNLEVTDFFDTNSKLANSQKFDLIIGNPPWQSELTDKAEDYLINHDKYVIGDNQISQLFAWKCSDLLTHNGYVCLLLPSKGFLFNRSTTNKAFRSTFFTANNVTTIINFTNYKKVLFKNAKFPATAIFYSNRVEERGTHLYYCSPKPTFTVEDSRRFLIEPLDISRIPIDMIQNDYIWKIAMFGGPRDLELIGKIQNSNISLGRIVKDYNLVIGEGFQLSKGKDEYPQYLGYPLVKTDNIEPFYIEETNLPKNENRRFHRIRTNNLQIYEGDHIVVKQSPKDGRLIASLLDYKAVFNHSFLGIHGSSSILKFITIILNSSFCTYFFLMTSGRWIIERSELEAKELKLLPLPIPTEDVLNSCESLYDKITKDKMLDYNEVDNLVFDIYSLNNYERSLIIDANKYIYGINGSSKFKSLTNKTTTEQLSDFGKTITEILTNTFGTSHKISFQALNGNTPLIIVKVVIGDSDDSVTINKIHNNELQDTLERLDDLLLSEHSQGLFVRRSVVMYEKNAVYIIKPNQENYWTFSLACREADEIYNQIMRTWRTL